MAVNAAPPEAATDFHCRTRVAYDVSARCGYTWGSYLVDCGVSTSLIRRQNVPNSVPIEPQNGAISLHEFPGHEIPFCGTAEMTLDFGHMVKIRQTFLVCEDELFPSTAGILGLDFLEDNNVLIDVKRKRIRLQNKWVRLSSRIRDLPVLHVARRKDYPRKTLREVKERFRGVKRDPDQSPTIPLAKSALHFDPPSPTIPLAASAAKYVYSATTPLLSEPKVRRPFTQEKLRRLLEDFERTTWKLRELISILVSALSSPPLSIGERPRGSGTSGGPSQRKHSAPGDESSPTSIDVSPADNFSPDLSVVSEGASKHAKTQFPDRYSRAERVAPVNSKPQGHSPATRVVDSLKSHSPSSPREQPRLAGAHRPLRRRPIEGITPSNIEAPRPNRPEDNETANESVIADSCKIAPHDVKLDRKSIDDPNKAIPAPGDVPSRDAVPEPVDAKTYKSAFATPRNYSQEKWEVEL